MATENRVKIDIRTTQETVDRADALIAHVARMRGVEATRADVVREAIVQGMRVLEQEKADATDRKYKPSRLRKAKRP